MRRAATSPAVARARPRVASRSYRAVAYTVPSLVQSRYYRQMRKGSKGVTGKKHHERPSRNSDVRAIAARQGVQMDEHGTVGRRSENPSRSVPLEAATRRSLFRSLRAIWPLAVFLTAIALTCVIPGAIAGAAGVAVSRDVKAALTRTECPAKAEGFMKSANLWLHRFKGTCDATLPETANVHLEKRKYLGFVEGNSNYVYFAALFFLGLHVSYLRSTPRQSGQKQRLYFGATALAVCAVWIGHNIARTFWLRGEERNIVSYVNWDISPVSWLYQMLLSSCVCWPAHSCESRTIRSCGSCWRSACSWRRYLCSRALDRCCVPMRGVTR